MYSMWHPLLLWYLGARNINSKNIGYYFTSEELTDIVLKAIDATVTEYACELMMIHNVSLDEAKMAVAQRLVSL